MNRSLRWLLLSIIFSSVGLWTAGAALACDHCHRLGSTVFHDVAIGGGDSSSALFATAPLNDEGLASAQITSLGGGAAAAEINSGVTLTYSYNNLLDGGLKDINGVSLPISLIRGSIEEALQVWASAAPLHFVEVPDQGGGASQVNYPDGQFGQIRFNHVYINGPDIPGQPPIAKALAYYPSYGGNLARDVFFDRSDPWQEVGTLSRPDILGAAIHEIGHTLGLPHSFGELPGEYWSYTFINGQGQEELVQLPKGDANMFWIFHRYSGLGTGQLFPGDIAAIQQIYGAGVGSVTPLPVPEPAGAVLMAIAFVWCIHPGRSRRRFPAAAE